MGYTKSVIKEGGWTFDNEFYPDIVVGEDPNAIICEVNTEQAEAMGNAHLIASAPDLYEVLSKAIKDPEYVLSGEWYTPAAQAIAKAEGR